MTSPQLLALALGRDIDAGPERCFFCGAFCAAKHPAKQYVLDSFTNRNIVAVPGSSWVCHGCTLCLRESCAVDMIDGTRGRIVTKAAMRAFSWVLSERQALAASKAHLDRLREICLAPPVPPFSIVLSDSGKKHLLYRGVVCYSRDTITLTLEEEQITYQPMDLFVRLELCGRLIAATGKPALAEVPTVRMALNVHERFVDGLQLFSEWEQVHEQPLSRLAAWLSPGKDDCQQRYPASH